MSYHSDHSKSVRFVRLVRFPIPPFLKKKMCIGGVKPSLSSRTSPDLLEKGDYRYNYKNVYVVVVTPVTTG